MCRGCKSTINIDATAYQDIVAAFPNLMWQGFSPTRSAKGTYNCIAYAANDEQRTWWPSQRKPSDASRSYWPIQRYDESVANFVEAFSTIGYMPCTSGELEVGFEKIALYALDSMPMHMAYQVCDGTWRSKLGAEWDIMHTSVDGLAGEMYGSVSCYLRRARTLGE